MESHPFKTRKLPSFSDFYDGEGQDNIVEIKNIITDLGDKIPQEVIHSLLEVIENSEYDIIEKNYTDYISDHYDRNAKRDGRDF